MTIVGKCLCADRGSRGEQTPDLVPRLCGPLTICVEWPVVQLLTRRFTADEFHRMGEAGILGEDDRVELIDGQIVPMSPIGYRHAGAIIRLTRALSRDLHDRALVSVQNPVRLGEHEEPQPDLVVLRPRPDDYTTRLPEPADVLLLVEVADSSLEHDRDLKAPLYARAGIPEYWLWDLDNRQVLVHRGPTPEGYASIETFDRASTVSPAAFPEIRLPLGDHF